MGNPVNTYLSFLKICIFCTFHIELGHPVSSDCTFHIEVGHFVSSDCTFHIELGHPVSSDCTFNIELKTADMENICVIVNIQVIRLIIYP